MSIPEAEEMKSTKKNTVKVDLEKVDSILDSIGELVVLRSQLINAIDESLPDKNARSPRLISLLELYDRSIRDLQDRATSLRMTPLRSLFLKLQRVVRDLSIRENKDVYISFQGEDVEIDRQIVETLADPLMHMIRNSMDHGLETREQRRLSGKSEKCQIEIKAKVTGGYIEIKFQDDGRGIDFERVFLKAQERKLLPSDMNLSQATKSQLLELLFVPGFSTAEEVTEVSGRGIGLDVVRSQILKLKGQILIESEASVGTSFKILLPVSAAVTDGILVKAGGPSVLVPMGSLCSLMARRDIQLLPRPQGKTVFLWNQQMLPYLRLRDLLKMSSTPDPVRTNSIVLVIQFADRIFGLEIDEILGQSQVVSKSVKVMEGKSSEPTGTAILGDGKIALILEPNWLKAHLQSQDLLEKSA